MEYKFQRDKRFSCWLNECIKEFRRLNSRDKETTFDRLYELRFDFSCSCYKYRELTLLTAQNVSQDNLSSQTHGYFAAQRRTTH